MSIVEPSESTEMLTNHESIHSTICNKKLKWCLRGGIGMIDSRWVDWLRRWLSDGLKLWDGHTIIVVKRRGSEQKMAVICANNIRPQGKSMERKDKMSRTPHNG
jgi:hypothetical protein